jgi:hypothetical protein
MGKILKLTESQMKLVVDDIINEGGQRGKWKESWTPEDQALAMYNSVYGIEDLGFSKKEVAEKVIGSSVGSLVQQSLNFDFLDGKISTYDRDHKLQPEIYNRFKGIPHQDFKNYCLDIIERRFKNPEESVTKMQLGRQIGDKRDEITTGREDGLRKLGVDPKNFKIKSVRPKFEPSDDEPEMDSDIIQNEKPQKNDIQQYLESMHSLAIQMKKSGDLSGIDKLIDDLEYLDEYLGLNESRIRKSVKNNLRRL